NSAKARPSPSVAATVAWKISTPPAPAATPAKADGSLNTYCDPHTITSSRPTIAMSRAEVHLSRISAVSMTGTGTPTSNVRLAYWLARCRQAVSVTVATTTTAAMTDDIATATAVSWCNKVSAYRRVVNELPINGGKPAASSAPGQSRLNSTGAAATSSTSKKAKIGRAHV